MSFKVIVRFKEKNHKDHVYEVGKPYPAEGFKADKSRTDELSTNKNKYKIPFLKEVKTPKKIKE